MGWGDIGKGLRTLGNVNIGGMVAGGYGMFKGVGHDAKKNKAVNLGGPGTGGHAGGAQNTLNYIQDSPAEKIQKTKLDGGPMSRRFGQMRDRAGSEINAGAQKNADALTRRFSSFGSSGSGAAIKMQQQAAEEADQLKANTMRDIDIQEEDVNMARESQQAQMDQQVNLAQADMNFRQKAFNFERGSKLHELNLAERQLAMDASTTDFNKRVAAEQMKKPKQGIISGVLDGIL
jgi:hypothetical protein